MNGRERSTAEVRRVDVSALDNRASAAPATYLRVGSHLEVRPCACGGGVLADPHDPGRGVAAHQFTSRHKAWREANDL